MIGTGTEQSPAHRRRLRASGQLRYGKTIHRARWRKPSCDFCYGNPGCQASAAHPPFRCGNLSATAAAVQAGGVA